MIKDFINRIRKYFYENEEIIRIQSAFVVVWFGSGFSLLSWQNRKVVAGIGFALFSSIIYSFILEKMKLSKTSKNNVDTT